MAITHPQSICPLVTAINLTPFGGAMLTAHPSCNNLVAASLDVAPFLFPYNLRSRMWGHFAYRTFVLVNSMLAAVATAVALLEYLLLAPFFFAFLCCHDLDAVHTSMETAKTPLVY